MKIFIASSEEHSGKIEEDMYINNMCISLGIESEISTIKNIIKKARKNDFILIKSIWGYYKNSNLFLSQIKKLKENDVKIINDSKFIFWNVNKINYLKDIKNIGIIPTYPIFQRKIKSNKWLDGYIENISKKLNTKNLVIKPCIGESGYLTNKINIESDKKKILNIINKNNKKDFILQPYIPEISKGEISIINIQGKIMYGIKRFPGILIDKRETKYINNKNIPIEIKNIINNLNKYLSKKFKSLPTIARIDFIHKNNKYYILEVELIDPDLFFRKIPKKIKKEVFLEIKKSIFD